MWENCGISTAVKSEFKFCHTPNYQQTSAISNADERMQALSASISVSCY